MPDLRQALRDFVTTSNSGKYSDEATLLSKFPELKGYSIEVLRDFVTTSNSGKYATEEELFSKFPEFKFDTVEVKKKEEPVTQVQGKKGTALPSASGSLAASKTPTEKVSVGPMGMVGLERTKEYRPDDKQGWLLNTVSSLDKGFYKNLVGNPVKGLGTLLEGATGKGFVSDALIKFGNYFNNAIDELTPQDEEFKNSLSDQFGQAFGQVVHQHPGLHVGHPDAPLRAHPVLDVRQTEAFGDPLRHRVFLLFVQLHRDVSVLWWGDF